MKMQVMLDGNELKAIVSKALNIPLENVKPTRYSIAVENMPAEEVDRKVKEYLEAK